MFRIGCRLRFAYNGIVRDVTARKADIISCGEDGKVMCFDLDLKELAEIDSDENFVTSLCWANDQELLSSSYTGRIESHNRRLNEEYDLDVEVKTQPCMSLSSLHSTKDNFSL